MPTVYITNKSVSHDYTPATRYGGLRFITTGNFPMYKFDRLIEDVGEGLRYSTPDDYLLPSGSAIITALALAFWLEQHQKVNVLLWDQPKMQYVLRVINKATLRMEIQRQSDLKEAG